ncbi:MAG: carbamoyltransferase HypF [Desulfobulbus sp.]|nr:carbamoyltransferase HypF [Desulfobulbus sp.]
MHPVHTQHTACRIVVRGMVQGVGFRPFVYRLALRLGLAGTVANNGEGVHIHVAGSAEVLKQFVTCLRAEAPPVARIGEVSVKPADPPDGTGFCILRSDRSGTPNTQIAPDIAVCTDCLAEIRDPANRRYRYPFANCTNCGPRFTIVTQIPYDRPNTSMHVFTLCDACRDEYHDPLNRRFHAQPNACPVCGPQLSWHDAEGALLPGDALQQAAAALSTGAVVAIKGLGGFHLAVDAGSDEAVARLRACKRRPTKPLAVMIADLAAAEHLCQVSPVEADLLVSPEHPIVLLDRRRAEGVSEGVAPGLGVLGVMLAYTPLHHLLLDEGQAPAILVMTSGNRSDEPICTGNDEALGRLKGLADFFLFHNRDIVTRVDDSVARVMAGRPRLLRRARGYSPVPIPLQRSTHDILGCGAEMKSSFCIVRHDEAYLSQHIGELTGPECYDFYRESIAHLQGVLEVTPPRVVCDLHPDYLSSRYARSLGLPCTTIQHHHAHVGAVLAEAGLDGPVLGLVLDGTGHGGDSTVFGGEIYLADRSGFERLGRLAHLALPGGDRAAREPWRMALALLYCSLGKSVLDECNQLPALQAIDPQRKAFLGEMIERGLNCPPTSSCGRLFDAVSALLGLCATSSYEGEAAMLLEDQARRVPAGPLVGRYPVTLSKAEGLLVLDSAPLGPLLLAGLQGGEPIPLLALRFHHWLVDGCTALLKALRDRTGLTAVALTGGCMQNKLFFETLVEALTEHRFTVHAGELVPMNDGGISLGQAYLGGNPCV